MKNLKQLYEELETRRDFQIIKKGFDGGMVVFTKGSLKNMTVIWSYGGGWEHVSIDGKNRTPTWDEMCSIKDMFFSDDKYQESKASGRSMEY